MKVTFLGTGTSQGVPIIACDCEICSSADPKDKRLRSSILVEHDGHQIVVDTGPDFREQMLRSQIKQLDAILFTHAHRDHLAGLDDIRGFNFRMKRAIDVYCEHRVEKAIRKEFFYAFEEPKYPGVPEMNIHTISSEPFQLFGLPIIPIQVYHHKLPVLGFRFGDFVYITDANRIEPKEMDKIRGCKVLVLNALRREYHISHFTLDEAIAIVQEIKPETAYFTHISHQLGLHQDLEIELPENIHLAHDGLTLHF
ncbi:MAG: MBL fold metallo-hydrolase [Bacteroidia bacterium]|nr:MBL fold metallo-hydrolase [Bacteroidia bacterium]MCF8426071.1 MBL fold metallo-hydrolase [Bacteroidia bacterium]